MHRSVRRTLSAVAANLGMLVLVLAIGTQGLPGDGVGNGADVEVLGRVEVRGQRFNLSDGRTARTPTAASGLTTPDHIAPEQSPSGAVLVGDAARHPGVVVADVPDEPDRVDVPEPGLEGSTAENRVRATGTARDAQASVPSAAPRHEPPDTPDVPAVSGDARGPGAVAVDAEVEPDPHRRLGDEAITLIAYPWRQRLPSWTVTFHGAREGTRGLTFSAEQRIEIYIRPQDGAWDLARVLVHELGHAVDLSLMDAGDRARWMEQRNLDPSAVSWWPVSGESDFATGAGDFAECFATWQLGSASLSQVGGACSAADLGVVAALS